MYQLHALQVVRRLVWISRANWLFAFVALLSHSALQAFPGAPSPVIYDPITRTVEGDQPLSYSYTLTVTSPSILPAGVPVTVTLVIASTAVPAGATSVQALSFVTLEKPVMVFTGPNQSITTTVSLSVPTGFATGDFTYKINTVGWPTLNIVDASAFINMHVQPPLPKGPPVVVINQPYDGSGYAIDPGATLTVPFQFDVTAPASAPVTSISATLITPDQTSLPIAIVSTGLNSILASGTNPLSITTPGTYTIVATGTNEVGTVAQSVVFNVDVVYPPPTVTITQPPNSTYDIYLGGAALVIPFVFEGHSFEGGIRTLSATLNKVPVTFVSSDVGTLIATGSGSLAVGQGGDFLLEVTAVDDHGSATAAATFSVNLIRPSPVIVINDPLSGTVLTHTMGTPALSVPFTFTMSTSAGFTVNSISAQLDGNAVPVTVISGLNTIVASGSGILNSVAPGVHVLTAFGSSAGIPVQTSATFTVVEFVPPMNPPPTVVINTPIPNSTYTIAATGCGGASSLTIPLTFTGTSNAMTGVITKLTATIDGHALTVASSTLSQKVANGSANMVITTAGTHTIKVAAVDAYGTATATRTFAVTVSSSKYAVRGTVFFDVNFNGTQDTDDYGISGATVKLLDSSGRLVATTTSATNGSYTFNVLSGNYIVSVGAQFGMSLTTLNDQAILVSNAPVSAPSTGFGLKFTTIKTLCASGFTIGYWKNNIDKALAGKTSGTQVSAAALKSYTTAIGTLALSPLNGLTMSGARATMGSTSSAPADLLAKQLVASEYNYANGAFIGGNRNLTYAFIYYAEYVLKNSTSYSSTYVIWVKDWCDAYNNSHGGLVLGPSA